MPSAQADLFAPLPAPPPIPGLASFPEIVSPAEELALIAAIDAAPLEPFRFQGWLGKRLTVSYGWRYDFDDASLGPTDPIPDAFLPVRGRAAALAGLAADQLVQCLLIRYDPGAGIGWHRDRPVFGDVVGVSLGAPAAMRFRRRTPSGFERRTVPLPPRGAYHLGGEAREVWEHSIAETEETRWSVTFRSMRGERRAP
jgi:alkylated DNA repair dioxygenase AlkB